MTTTTKFASKWMSQGMFTYSVLCLAVVERCRIRCSVAKIKGEYAINVIKGVKMKGLGGVKMVSKINDYCMRIQVNSA